MIQRETIDRQTEDDCCVHAVCLYAACRLDKVLTSYGAVSGAKKKMMLGKGLLVTLSFRPLSSPRFSFARSFHAHSLAFSRCNSTYSYISRSLARALSAYL